MSEENMDNEALLAERDYLLSQRNGLRAALERIRDGTSDIDPLGRLQMAAIARDILERLDRQLAEIRRNQPAPRSGT